MANSSNFEVSQDTIFITGLPEDTTEEQLSEYFGQIGLIKFDKKNNCPKIWIYKDKQTGKGKGEATLTYDDPPTATSAISWFDGKEFRGSALKIELAQRKNPPSFSRGGRGGGRGGYWNDGGRGGGGAGGYDRGAPRDDRGGARPGGPGGRPGDWLCPSCNNNNFAYRQECNRCRTQKPAGAGDSGGSGGGSGHGSSYNGGGSYGDGHRGGGYGDSHRGGSYMTRGSGGGSNYRSHDRGGRDRSDRPERVDRDRGTGERDRDRGSRDYERDRDRGGERSRTNYGDRTSGGGSNRDSNNRDSGGGPSRNHMRDDRRSRPY